MELFFGAALAPSAAASQRAPGPPSNPEDATLSGRAEHRRFYKVASSVAVKRVARAVCQASPSASTTLTGNSPGTHGRSL